ncbi:hypothetical protein FACS189490_05300 [Clostridia bacterium]|nr:hypothetical protein FACS189490_05300 [Clostridia bacterium]
MGSLSLQTNILALNAHRSAKIVGGVQEKSSQRLASGYRINTAADDSSGLAISEKMRAQIRGLDKAEINVKDGTQLAKTSDGGLDGVDSCLQRIRELCVQAANDTNESSDRKKIAEEIGQLFAEIDGLSDRVEFNKKGLLNDVPKVIYENVTYSTTPVTTVTNKTTTEENIAKRIVAKPDDTEEGTEITSTEGPFVNEQSVVTNLPAIDGDYYLEASLGVEIYFEAGQGRIEEGSETWITKTAKYEKVDDGTGNPVGITLAKAVDCVGSDGAPNFHTEQISADFPEVKLYCAMTRTEIAINGKLYNIYIGSGNGLGDSGTLSRSGTPFPLKDTTNDTVTNQYYLKPVYADDPDSEFLVRQIVTLDGDEYKMSYEFENKTQQDVDYDLRFSMDSLNKNSGDIATAASGVATIEDKTHGLTITMKHLDPAGEAIYGSINEIAGSFRPSTGGSFGSFDTYHTGGAFYVDGTLTPGETKERGGMSYAVNSDTLFYWEETTKQITDTTTTRELYQDSVYRMYQHEGLWIQSGANSTQGHTVYLCNVNCEWLGINNDKVDISDAMKATNAISVVDKALTKVVSWRAYYGASQNRLEYMGSAVAVSSENLSAADSRIRDADMAKETMSVSKAMVLSNAATSMITQSNQTPQNVMKLLQA